MQKTRYLLTVRDLSDFGKVLHRSVHGSLNAASTFGDALLNGYRAKTEPEWHSSFVYEAVDLPYFP